MLIEQIAIPSTTILKTILQSLKRDLSSLDTRDIEWTAFSRLLIILELNMPKGGRIRYFPDQGM